MEVVSFLSTHLDVISIDRERVEHPSQLLHGQPGIDQSADKHVPADPGEAIQIGNSHLYERSPDPFPKSLRFTFYQWVDGVSMSAARG